MAVTNPQAMQTPQLPAEPMAPACAEFDASVLERTPLFSGMQDDCRCVMTDRMEVRRYPAGSLVYSEGEQARELYILAQGEVDVVKKDLVLGRMAPGAFFGEASFLDMQPRGSTMRVKSDATVYVIPYAALRALYQVNLRMYALIMMNLGREVCRRLRTADALACGECKPPNG